MEENAETQPSSSGYSKRPLWQWIVIYLIVGVVVYGLIYYFVLAKKGGYGAPSSNSNSAPTQQNTNPRY